nr:putative ribonuclease H-like domain-containing protein [Tanacetum cinerariifolium]
TFRLWLIVLKGSEWVLKNKKDERGIVIRNKARLVAQGHTQEEGIDYDEVFAPVERIEAIRLFLAYASFMVFTVYQMDVKSAFLYDTIDEEPHGFQDPDFLAKVYKVEKAMHGLHQAPRAWYGTLSKYLLTNGFQRGIIDQTLFIGRQRGYFILVQVYVDDIIFGSSNPQLCKEFEALMHEKFQMSAMGELNFFFGLQVVQKEDGIFISQEKHQVTPKECHLHALKRIFRYLKGHPKLGLWYPKESPFDLVAYSDSDYGGATQDRKSTTGGCQFLDRRLSMLYEALSREISSFIIHFLRLIPLSEYNVNFHPIVDFVEASPLRIETTEEATKILATVDGILRTVTESSLRRNLKLQDEEGISSLPDTELFENLTLMGYNISPNQKFTFQKGQFSHQWKYLIHTIMQCSSPESTGFNEFNSNIATALVCLATNRTYNFSKMIFDGLVKNVNNKGEGSGTPTEPHHTPSLEAHPTLHTTYSSPTLLLVTTASIPTSLTPPPVADEPTSPLRDVSEGEACPTDSGFRADQDRANIAKTSTLPYDSAPRLEEKMERDAQRMNEQIARDAEIARIHVEEELQIMIDGLDRSNETVAKYIQEYHQFATELPLERRIELISDLVRYQDNYAKVHKFQTQQRKSWSKKQKRDYYMAVIKRNLGWKVKDFRGMTFEEIEAKFTTVWKQLEDFIPIGSKEEDERLKRKGLSLEQESMKKLKTSVEVPEEAKSPDEVLEEKVKEMMQLVPIEQVYVESLQVKHPIIDWMVHTEGQRSYWKITRLGGSSAIEWKLYDTCGVHHVTTKDKEIFMLVEKDYPLRKGLAIGMISYKLQVKYYSKMANDLIPKIYKIASSLRQQGD